MYEATLIPSHTHTHTHTHTLLPVYLNNLPPLPVSYGHRRSVGEIRAVIFYQSRYINITKKMNRKILILALFRIHHYMNKK